MARKAPNGFGSIRKKTVNGKTYFEARYTDPLLHKQKSISAATEAECRRKLREIQAKITMGGYVSPQKTLVQDWLAEWVEHRENIESSTQRLYMDCIRLYIAPALGRIRLQDLRYSHCQAFVHQLSHNPARALSAKTISNIVGVLSAALSAAVRAELIAVNPAADLEKPRVDKKPPVVMESAEQDAFLQAIQASPYQRIFLFGLNTGARISEILALRWKNIDFQTGAIIINAQLSRQRGEGTARTLKGTKTHKERTIIVPPFVLDMLKSQRACQNEWRLKAGPAWTNPDGLVFTRQDGSPVPHTSVSNAFKRIAVKMGRPDMSFHSLRHTFITEEIRNGTDPKTVSESAGHSTISMTMDVYAAATTEMKTAAALRRQDEYERKTSD